MMKLYEQLSSFCGHSLLTLVLLEMNSANKRPLTELYIIPPSLFMSPLLWLFHRCVCASAECLFCPVSFKGQTWLSSLYVVHESEFSVSCMSEVAASELPRDLCQQEVRPNMLPQDENRPFLMFISFNFKMKCNFCFNDI